MALCFSRNLTCFRSTLILMSIILTNLGLSGCSGLNPFMDSTNKAQNVAPNFIQENIQTKNFELYSLSKIEQPGAPVHIYVEGDGRAWLTKHQLSDNPTPKDMMFLKMATLDPHANVVYLARPCQFIQYDNKTVCASKYWSSHRNAPEVIASMQDALDKIKTKAKSSKIELYGYSGGGGIVVLLASSRQDVQYIATVAGNLDLELMDKHHKSTPLYGSLDPLKVASKVHHIPQNHFVGSKDKVVPPIIASHFKEVSVQSTPSNCVQVHVQKGLTHHNGWEKIWPQLLSMTRGC